MKRYENKDKKPTSILLKNSKKLPLKFNEVDINLLMSNPKTIHKFMDKGDAPEEKLENRPKNARLERPHYYHEQLFNGKPPKPGQQFELERIAAINKQKRKRKAEEQLEKLRAMQSPKEDIDDTPEVGADSKAQYSDKKEHTKLGNLVNKSVNIIQDTAVSGYDKGKELITDFIGNVKNKGFGRTVKDNVNEGKDLINKFINRKEFDNVREHLKKEPKKPEAKALNALLKKRREIEEKYLKNRS